MSNRQSTSKEISMAIRGYGALAAVSMFLRESFYDKFVYCVILFECAPAIPLQCSDTAVWVTGMASPACRNHGVDLLVVMI